MLWKNHMHNVIQNVCGFHYAKEGIGKPELKDHLQHYVVHCCIFSMHHIPEIVTSDS